MIMSDQERGKTQQYAFWCTVRYGSYHFRGMFGTNDETLRAGDTVIVRSPRDTEIGELVSAVSPRRAPSSAPSTGKRSGTASSSDDRDLSSAVSAISKSPMRSDVVLSRQTATKLMRPCGD